MSEHECVFPEEQEPEGRLILAPCLECGTPALEAIKEAATLKAELEAIRSESKRLAATAGKELLAAHAQNERLVLAARTALNNINQIHPNPVQYSTVRVLEEALMEASPSTTIHEAIEGAIEAMEHIYHAIRGCSDLVERDGFGDLHPKNKNLREAYKKVETTTAQLRKAVNKNG